MGTRKLEVVIVGDASSAQRSFRTVNGALADTEKKSKTAGLSVGGFGKSALKAGLAAGAGFGLATEATTLLTSAIGHGIDQYREQQVVSAQTANVLKTTGMAAGVTQEHVEDLASSLQDLTGSEDDAIQAGENVLLTFTKISATNGVFDRATAIANDMTVALGKDMPAAARIVGRALDDPIKGLGALSRIGVKFNDEQKAAFATWVKNGDIARAQGAILSALERRYKGAAQSQGVLTETSQRLARRWDDLSESMTAGGIRYANQALISLNRYINANVIPTINSLKRAWSVNLGGFPTVVRAVMATVVSSFRTQMRTMIGILSATLAVLRGDWSGAWNAMKGIVKAQIENMKQLFLSLPKALYQAGLAAGSQFASGVIAGIGNLGSRILAKVGIGTGGTGSAIVPRSVGGTGKPLQEGGPNFALRSVPLGSPTSLSRIGARGDAAATTARVNAEDRARASGADSEAIRTAGDKAYANARKATLNALTRAILTRRGKLVKKLAAARKAARAKITGTPAQKKKIRQQRLDAVDAANRILDELETLASDYAQDQAELKELDAQIADLDRGDEAGTAGDAASDAPTERDFLEAAAAEATLTPGTADDITAAGGLVGLAERELAAARASGDPRRITAAIETLRQAQQNLDALKENTDALNANTEATKQSFGGSVAFSSRGQSYVLGSLALPSSDRLTGMEVLL